MEKKGVDYYLEKDILERYKKKPLEWRLEWLYMGNELRKHYPEKTIKVQEKFRKGEI